MAIIDTNPDDLDRVAQAIIRATNEINAAIRHMDTTLKAAHWNDLQRKKFDNDYTSLVASLKKFQTEAPKSVQHLKTKANQLKQY